MKIWEFKYCDPNCDNIKKEEKVTFIEKVSVPVSYFSGIC